MKQFAVLMFALIGCAFSLPTPEDECNCGNVTHPNFEEKNTKIEPKTVC